MKNQNNENENITIARELSHKFEFYFIALVFTILGLSIQTSSFIKDYFQYIFEIFAWVSFLISGLAGLSRLEWIPFAYCHYGSLQTEKNNLKVIKEGINRISIINESGQKWTEKQLQKAKGDLETQILKRDKEIEKVDKHTLIKYQLHKWSFILGLISLIISRAIINLDSVFKIK